MQNKNTLYEILQVDDFEPVSDAFFNPLSSYQCENISFGEKNFTNNGVQCMKISPAKNVLDGSFSAVKAFETSFLNKRVWAYIYDDLDENRNVIMQLTEQPNATSNIIFIGLQNGKLFAQYKDRYSALTTPDLSFAKRSEGWHKFMVDFTLAGKIALYMDDTLLAQIPVGRVYTVGMSTVSFVSLGSKELAKDQSVYVDDVTIATPTPVPSEIVFDTVTGYVDWEDDKDMLNPEEYELSIDNGNTYVTCKEKPVFAGEKIDYTKISLRCKAPDLAEYVYPSIVVCQCAEGKISKYEENFVEVLPETVTKEMLSSLVDFCDCSNKNDYTCDSYAKFNQCLVQAKDTINTNGDYKTAYEQIKKAQSNLEFNMESNTVYNFNDCYVPSNPLVGTPVWSEKENISYVNEKSYKIVPAIEDDKQKAKWKYTFLKPLAEKQITFCVYDENSTKISIKFGNSIRGEELEITSQEGSETYFFCHTNSGVKKEPLDRGFQRNTRDIRKFEINLTNGNKAQLFMDDVLAETCAKLKQIDYIEISMEKDATQKRSYLTIDELTIRDANAVTNISYPNDTIELGYYDTFEMNICNYILQTPHSYPTTDKFTYSIENPDVAKITKGGSIQPMAITGTTKSTISNGKDVSKTITVIVNDYKPTDVKISDSIITTAPNYVTNLQLEPGDIKVLNAIITPANVTNYRCNWTSSNEEVVKVTDGKLEAIAEGSATITVQTIEGNSKAVVNIKVENDQTVNDIEMFVCSINGDDNLGTGSIEKPFKTLEKARDTIRSVKDRKGRAVIYLREGTYFRSQSLKLDERDGGKYPLKITAYNKEKVVLTGALELLFSQFTKVTDEETLLKIPEQARGKVYSINLKEELGKPLELYTQNFERFLEDNVGVIWADYNKPYYNVSMDGKLMTLSRWPNPTDEMEGCMYPGYSKIDEIPYKGATIRDWMADMKGLDNYVELKDRDVYDSFECKCNTLAERMKTWNGIPQDGSNILEHNVWYSGFTGVDYTVQAAPIRNIKADGTIKSNIATLYAIRNAPFTRLYVYNLLQELDIPGEWYLDARTMTLYIYPPQGLEGNLEDKVVSIARLAQDMFELKDCSNVTVEGLTITNTLGGAISFEGGHDNKISRCRITNTSTRIAEISDSKTQQSHRNGVYLCDIQDVNGGVIINETRGTATLTPGCNYVTGCYFRNFSTLTSGNNPAVMMYGTGDVVCANEMCYAPNNAIMWRGNDNVIEFNNIHHVAQNTTDSCAIYVGRTALARGAVVKNNYIHHIGKNGCTTSRNIAIYIDDMSGGNDIYDNIIENIYWAVFINGGQDNHINNNVIKKCHFGVIATDWSYCWLHRWYQHGYCLKKDSLSLQNTTIDWQNPESPYSKYNHLSTMLVDAPNDSIYNTMIGNYYPETVSLFEYRKRGVIPNEVALIKDWYFTKNNVE